MDVKIIEKRVAYMLEKLEDLSYDLDKLKITKNLRDRKTIQGAIERWSEEIVESAININNEILNSKGIISNSYFESFSNLETLNIFDSIFIRKIASTAGFRNRLAHDYMNLDDEVVLISVELILKLYKEYVEKINEYINTN